MSKSDKNISLQFNSFLYRLFSITKIYIFENKRKNPLHLNEKNSLQ